MNWISAKLKSFVEKAKNTFKRQRPSKDDQEKSLWTSCDCKNLIYKEDLESNFFCCPKCGYHHKLTCIQRFNTFFDSDYTVLEHPNPIDDVIGFKDKKSYKDRLEAARKLTKQRDTALIASGNVKGIKCTVGSMDFRVIGGSMGKNFGEAFLFACNYSIEHKQPLVFFCTSGGARLMESTAGGLMQMTRSVLGVNELKKKNIPFIVVLTEPSTGGSLASWASLGDLQISEKNVRNISFAGARVVQQTIRETLPDDFGSSKFQMDKGQVDLIVERKDLNSTIGTLLNILTKKAELVDNQSNVKVDKSIQTAS